MAKKEISWILRARDSVTSVLNRVGKRFAGFAKAGIQMAKRLAQGLMVVGAAAVAMGARAVRAYQVKAAALSKLQAVLRATGYAAGFTSSQLQKQANDLQRQTGVANEVILSMQAVLATFKQVQGDEFVDATAAIIDMATVMQRAGASTEQLESQAVQVGKALNDPIRGLSMLNRVGIQFTDQQREMITTMQRAGDMVGAQRIILGELQSQFGGAAAGLDANVKGYRVFKAAMGDATAEVGRALTENMALSDTFEGLTQRLENLVESGIIDYWAERLAEGIQWVMQWLGPLIEGFRTARDFIAQVAGAAGALTTGAGFREAWEIGGQGIEDIRQTRDERLAAIRAERAERRKLREEAELAEMAMARTGERMMIDAEMDKIIQDMEHRISLQRLLNKGQQTEAELLRVQQRLGRDLTADEQARLRERIDQLRQLEGGMQSIRQASERDAGSALLRMGGSVGQQVSRADREGLRLDQRRNTMLARMQTSLERLETLQNTRMT